MAGEAGEPEDYDFKETKESGKMKELSTASATSEAQRFLPCAGLYSNASATLVAAADEIENPIMFLLQIMKPGLWEG